MILRPSNKVENIDVLEIVWRIFNNLSPYEIEDSFSEEMNYRTKGDIQDALHSILGIDMGCDLTNRYCEEDLDNINKIVFNTIHNLLKTNKENQ